MRILAVDFGDARTGIAVSDAMGLMAGETFVVREASMEKTAVRVCAEAARVSAGTIVVGNPKNMHGTVGERSQKAERLAALIRGRCDVPVVLWDERLTTVAAHQILSDVGRRGRDRKNTVDAVAASLILEGYLGYLRNRGES